VSSSDSESLVALGLASLIIPCEESIVMSSSGSGLVDRPVSVFCVLGGALFWGGVCFGFDKLFKRASVSSLLYPSPIGVGDHPSCCLSLTSRCWRTVSFYLVRWSGLLCCAVLCCGHEADSASQSGRLSRSLRSFSLLLEVLLSIFIGGRGGGSRYGCRICL
jgi:hypothetical protein